MTGARPSLISRIAGNRAALEEWRAAVASDRLHHAWLLQGPRGVGKAHAALRMGAGLLGVPDGDAEGAVAQLIDAGSHPDLRIVNVPLDDKGKAKSEIPVDSIRELARFFTMRPALGGWRIGIIDSVGELNRNGANALLKTLEEPPKLCVLFLVAHDGDFVLPTIRSRVRTMRFTKLSDDETRAVLAGSGMTEADARDAANMVPGQPGLGAQYASTEGLAGFRAASSLMASRLPPSAQALSSMTKAAGKSQVSFDAALETIRRQLIVRASQETATLNAGRIAHQATQIGEIRREANALNMDRAQALVKVIELLRDHSTS